LRRALALALLLAAAPADAREVWSRGDQRLELAGSVREVLTTSNGTDPEAFADEAAADPASCLLAATFARCAAFDTVGDRDVWQSLTRLRLDATWHFRLRWYASLVYDHELRFGVFDGLLLAEPPDTFLGLEDEIHAAGFGREDGHRVWRHRVYRGFVHYEGEHLQATVGRQRIAWGVGRLWNPIDRFNAIGPLAIEADESPGVDAVEVRWLWTGFDYVEAVYAPGTSGGDARAALRAHGVVRDVDVSLVAGVIEEALTLGFDATGNLGGSAWRLEAVYADPGREVWELGAPRPQELAPFWQIVAGVDGSLEVGDGVQWLVEHLYDQNALGFGHGRAGIFAGLFGATAQPPAGLPAGARGPFPGPLDPDRFGGSRVVSFARHTTGAQLGSDFGAALHGDLLVLYDWNGGSAAFVPTLRVTAWNDVELTLGVQLFAGPRRSQYGPQQAVAFALLEVFF
jgi:hypothetical protein